MGWRLHAGKVALPIVLALAAQAAGAEPAPRAAVAVDAEAATVGDRLSATMTVELPAGSSFDPPDLGSSLGPFSVFSGTWSGPTEVEGRLHWEWRGTLTAFETGELEVPVVTLTATTPDGPVELRTDTVAVHVESVLDEAAGEEELADIKPPVSLPPEYGMLATGLAIFAALLAASLLLWWLQRRYASRLSAVPAPVDPFQRIPPHEWVYRELQRLLERRLAEHGQVDRFYSELARILKLYLEGRYRVDLMERTTQEVASRLEQGGATAEAVGGVLRVLERCDRVKFAGERPEAGAWRAEIEAVYEIVDRTKPADAAGTRAGRGAA